MRRAPLGGSCARPRATRGRSPSLRLAVLAAVAMLPLALAIPACSQKKADETEALGFQIDSLPPDSATLAAGKPLLTDFEPYRAADGAMRVRGRFSLPDGARLEISVKNAADGKELAREQVIVLSGGFDTPPMPYQGAPLPEGNYRFDIRTEFNGVWQPPNVLDATRSGLTLTGPGISRGAHGEAVYRMTIEKHL